ncbi:MerR family transcriptional regulator [Psychromonas sp. SP041]|uniref:MerR family transcriptional regulator n=1 Tax=Psychromonas sp. SP041 TaxID=1365007 RepID=UPI000470D5AC|nr:MerR family transcriptional regulator [Psychromonas sp. SP041]
MNIKKFSQVTKVSAHTLRYYEKIGLLKNIARNSSGHRWFTEKEVLWIEFIKRLKETGMSLEHIAHYADLREQGNITSDCRMKMLEQHALTLEAKIEEEQFHLKKLQQKITYYKSLLANNIEDKI